MSPARIIRLTAALAALPQALPSQPEVVIRSTTRLVQVHVVARDNQGRPVTDLRREDFRIFDDRKERTLTSFIAEGTTSDNAVPGDASRVVNEADGVGNGYSAILLDWLNGGIADRLRGGDAVRKVLKTFQARQKVGVFVLGMEPPNVAHPLRMVCDFTEESAEIANVLEDPAISEIGEAPGKFDARSGSAARTASAQEQLFDWRNRILDTVHGLTDLADRMAHLPGKKSLIWMSNGFPTVIDGSLVPGARPAEDLYLDEVERVLARFNRLNITIHPVNTRGLAASGRSFGPTLREFAERTGGILFSDRNDLDVGVQGALEDLHAGYTLGFLVPEDAAAGRHALLVRTSRPNVKLRFRESYDLSN